LVAFELNSLDGAPDFELDWPDADKDAAAAALGAFLQAHEKELEPFPMKLWDTACPVSSVSLKK
jgi:hypothetical protein